MQKLFVKDKFIERPKWLEMLFFFLVGIYNWKGLAYEIP